MLIRDIKKGSARALFTIFSYNSKNSKIIGLANENIWSGFGEIQQMVSVFIFQMVDFSGTIFNIGLYHHS